MKSLFSELLDVLDDSSKNNRNLLNRDNLVKRIISKETNRIGSIPDQDDFMEMIKFPKVVKNIIRSVQEKVSPVLGSVVYCDLMDVVEHSGIYIGDNRIVHFSGTGKIEAVSPQEFVARLNGRNKSMYIEVSCINGYAVGSEEVAEQAIKMIGCTRYYNLILDNCHQFTSGCLSGDFENADNFLWMLRDEAKRVLGADSWRAWER